MASVGYEETSMSGLVRYLNVPGYEQVICFNDTIGKLRGFISIHSNKLGPATGGTRMREYSSQSAALRDVLRLSKAMSYKCALAGVPFGGGKGVIIGNPKRKTAKMLRTYGRVVDTLQGKFTTGTDVGITVADTATMARESRYILGCTAGNRHSAADMAARGVFLSMKTVLKELDGNTAMRGKKIAVKGVGKLGYELVRLLIEAGVEVWVADVDPLRLRYAQKTFPRIVIVKPSEISKLPVDIYSPCALGGEFTLRNLDLLRCRAVVGGSNNQFFSHEVGDGLFKQGILYAPDYVVNAGGLIHVVDELGKGGYSLPRVLKKIQNIQHTLQTIFTIMKREKISPHRIADRIAEECLG